MSKIKSRVESLENRPQADEAAIILNKIKAMTPDQRQSRFDILRAKLFDTDISALPDALKKRFEKLRELLS